MYRKVLSFLMVLVVLSVLIFFFSCSLSPRLTKVPDTTRPSVTITFPTNGQILFTNEVTITGTASDEGSGVKEVWLSVNGGSFGLVNGTTNWSTNVTVNYGSNTIRVYAVDNSNNVSTTNTVSFVVGDNVRPVVLIVSPTNNEVIYTNVVSISGTASDEGSGVKEVWLSVNDGDYGKVNGTTNWSTNVTVNYGSNTIRVYAVDNSNNVSTTNTVSFVVVDDTNKPSVSITTPTNGQVFYDTTITVSGTASDVGSGVKEVWLSVNGGSFSKVNGTTNWSTNVVANYGSNTISVYAVDNLNNVSVTNIVSFVVVVKTIYVSTSGDNGNNGLSPSTSVRSLVRAMEVANTIDSGTNVLVKVGSGVYTPGNGLNSTGSGFVINRPNLIISGGWNSDFSSVVGKSELDGNSSLYHVVMITNVTNVRLENLVIRGGNANGGTPNDSGGGIYVSKVSYLVIESSVVISNNYADSFGGGLYLDRSLSNTIVGSVYGNSAAWYGGGVYLSYSSSNTISGSVYGNSANQFGGGLYLDHSLGNTVDSSVYGNSAINGGGGLYLSYSSSNIISGSVYSNSAANGGGVHLYNSIYNTISANVYGNSASQLGGGVYLSSSSYNTISSNVYGNKANSFGGGVYLIYSSSNMISGSVYGNSAINGGGGVILYYSTNNTISGNVYNNVTANYNGGGVNLDSSSSNMISGSVYSNRANSGGGVYLYVSTYNTISGNVYSNYANLDGGGVKLENNSTCNTIIGNVYCNNTKYGGGVYLWSSSYNTIVSSVYGNSASQLGGGVYLTNSDYFTNIGWITNNTASSNGGGVYTNNPHPNSYFGHVANNTPNNFN
jgi:hypothetical protein